MKIFLDTAGIDEIRTAARWGVLDGVTTNPSLFAKVGGSYDEVLKQICQITPGPVSAEVVADDVEDVRARWTSIWPSTWRCIVVWWRPSSRPQDPGSPILSRCSRRSDTQGPSITRGSATASSGTFETR